MWSLGGNLSKLKSHMLHSIRLIFHYSENRNNRGRVIIIDIGGGPGGGIGGPGGVFGGPGGGLGGPRGGFRTGRSSGKATAGTCAKKNIPRTTQATPRTTENTTRTTNCFLI